MTDHYDELANDVWLPEDIAALLRDRDRLRRELARVERCCERVEAVLAFCGEDHGPNTWVPRLRAIVAGAGRDGEPR